MGRKVLIQLRFEVLVRFDLIWVWVGEGKETFDLVEVLVRFD